jgi:hypothetical protein
MKINKLKESPFSFYYIIFEGNNNEIYFVRFGRSDSVIEI